MTTHAELVARAARWLRKTRGCGVVLTERACQDSPEVPDAIGWVGPWSILVECKTSVADFRRDLTRKPFRSAGGMGQERWFLVPPTFNLAGLPAEWGLLEAHPRALRTIVRPKRGCGRDRRPEDGVLDPERCAAEVPLLVSFARRTQLGVEPTWGSDLDPEARRLAAYRLVGVGGATTESLSESLGRGPAIVPFTAPSEDPSGAEGKATT